MAERKHPTEEEIFPEPPTEERPAARPPTRTRSRRPRPRPRVKLGSLHENGIGPAVFVLVERGAQKRPAVAKALEGRVELRFKEKYAPVRITFSGEETLVEDGDGGDFTPDLVIQGTLPDIVHLASAPLAGGVPKLTDPRGRAALRRVANRKVRIVGNPLLARRLLKLLEV
jgi:hypothetical protein